MFREKCLILENKKIAPGHFVLKLASAGISKNARPGQFVQILCADSYEPLLPRPFSFLTASKKDFSILYQVVGNGTKILSQAEKGGSLWVVGPLGNGFTIKNSRQKTVDRIQEKQKSSLSTVYRLLSTVILVGGGVGIPPLYHLAQFFLKSGSFSKKSIYVFLGARRGSLLLCEKDFKKLGVDLKISTDDGSKGKKGFVTEILDGFIKSRQEKVDRIQEKQKSSLSTVHRLPSTRIFACGPAPMLKAVSSVSKKYAVPCEVSVEVPMACGFGACLGCAIKVKNESRQNTEDCRQERQKAVLSTDYCLPSTEYRFAIACCEGPVFQANDIVWD